MKFAGALVWRSAVTVVIHQLCWQGFECSDGLTQNFLCDCVVVLADGW